MSPSWRCSACGVSWPPVSEYAKCPQCEAKCDSMAGPPTVDVDDARRAKLYAEFEAFYQGEWQQRKLQAAADEIAALPTIDDYS